MQKGFAHLRLMLLLAAVALLALGSAACAGQAAKAKPTIVMAEWNWDSQLVLTKVVENVIRDQLGYPVQTVKIAVTPTWAAMCKGEVDFVVEAWLPARKLETEPFLKQGCLEFTHQVFGGAIQGWFVPRYVIYGDDKRGIKPLAPNLRRIDQLNDYVHVFRHPEKRGVGELVDGAAGWINIPWNLSRIKGYGLKYEQTSQAEAVMLARTIAADKRGEPILLYMWRPHWIFASVDLVQLEEVDPWRDDCFEKEGEPYRCSIDTSTTWSVTNPKLKEKAPEVYRFLQQFEAPIDDVEKVMLLIGNEKKTIEEVAAAWAQENRAKLDAWVLAAKK